MKNELKGHAAWRYEDEPDEAYSLSHAHEPTRPLTQEEIDQAAELAATIVLFMVGSPPQQALT